MNWLRRDLSRRDFLKVAALSGAAAAGMPGCGGDDDGGGAGGEAVATEEVGGELRIIQWSHFVPAYDEWFDNTYLPQGGQEKRFGFPDNWVPDPVHWRNDLWGEAGFPDGPQTWDDVLAAGPELKAAGHPLGIGISQDIDANMALIAMMMCFGSYIQDEESNVTINSPETVETVRFMSEIFQAGMTNEVFSWDASSNNRFYVSGK